MAVKSLEEVLFSIFQGESNAANKYSQFSKASKNPAVQKVFSTTALAERIHAEKMRKLALRSSLDMTKFVPQLLDVEIADDKSNLEVAIKGEVYESTILYPQLAEVMLEQQNKLVSSTVTSLGKVEVEHAKLFELIKKFVKKAGFKGIIDIDIFEINGKYYISEVNPRFGGGYPHAYECGINVPKMINNNLNGKVNEEQIGNYEENIYMMKYNEIKILKG